MEISVGKKDSNTEFRATRVDSISKLEELIQKVNYSLGTFKDSYRNKENFIKAESIGLDFDGGYSIDQAREDFKEYAHVIAPTKSHRIEKNGEVADRFRVILFLESPITDADTFAATWNELFKRWPKADPKCKDPSRFWFASQKIDSSKWPGVKVALVAPPPVEAKERIDLDSLLPGTRGKLAKDVVEFLENGAAAGGRNHATFKAAKDFQQNLYSLDETIQTITDALNRNETFASNFTQSEAITTIRSAFNSEAKHDPRIKKSAFNLVPLGKLYETKTKVEWIVQDLLTVGGVSLISSDPKAGKSTLVRQLMRDILRQGSFLERKCKQGTVHYYAIEEQIEVVNASFQRLGLDGSEPLLVHVGDPLTETKFEDFKEILMAHKPMLAVIDTLFDFVDVESENNYKEVKRELRKLRQIARETGTHILLVHHNSKAQKDDKRRGNRGILGSQAIAGGVDTIMVIEVEGNDRLITSTGREIRQWRQRELVWDRETRTYSLGPEMDEY